MEECMFIKADEIRRLLGISRSKAYQIIRELNAELKSQGYMVLNGKVNLRHGHISLLIDMGFSAVAIADRVGHESIDITYRYAHLFPSKQITVIIYSCMDWC